MDQPVGEDVATLPVGRELDLIHGQKSDVPIRGHRFHGADEIPRRGRDDLFLARDQRH